MSRNTNVLAIDVGSSCIKLGWFPAVSDCPGELSWSGLPIASPPLPIPDEVHQVQHRDRPQEQWLGDIGVWMDQLPPAEDFSCVVASVHRAAASVLGEGLLNRGTALRSLTPADLPLEIRVAQPQRVGIDRLLGALAVNRLRRAGTPAISIDMGTATVVDLIAADGAFEGGAILAGPVLSMAALHGGTSSLPRLEEGVLADPPPAVGKSTSEAMAAGAFWGATGGVRELVERMAELCPIEPELYLTGGAAAAFAPFLGTKDRPPRYVPHLVLAGIALAADRAAP